MRLQPFSCTPYAMGKETWQAGQLHLSLGIHHWGYAGQCTLVPLLAMSLPLWFFLCELIFNVFSWSEPKFFFLKKRSIPHTYKYFQFSSVYVLFKKSESDSRFKPTDVLNPDRTGCLDAILQQLSKLTCLLVLFYFSFPGKPQVFLVFS